ncbi:MAG TPA: saccharopine dehydrogenase NADP-binding domain-containing protein [Actinomycetes bacterium]|nr:saccharopine dehydrogenase NADP-binding domain-containing protein [Actinomycetes bacterium]
MSEREFDLVLFGASGFVGRLVAAHLPQRGQGGRIALAGRSRDRLADVGAGLGVDWPLVVADAHDAAAMADLAARARVVLSTVGPYARYGIPLVQACALAGTDYADLTGEVLFVRESIERNHDVAVGTGARIVHSCGFDSVPSDLGVLLLAERARDDGEGELSEATLLVVAAKGGVSGGTVDSLRTQVDAVRADPALIALIGDPYALSPNRGAEPDLGPQPDTFLAERLDDGTWVAPFVMAPFNTRVVRRSNALSGHAYGRDLRYREVLRTGKGLLSPLAAAAMSTGIGALGVGLGSRRLRPLLDRVLPDPGTGPGEETRSCGHFTMAIRARTTRGARYVATISAHGDPGYAATSIMLGESGLCLAGDRDRLPDRAGVLTPATALGMALAARLRDNGFRLDVRRVVAP